VNREQIKSQFENLRIWTYRDQRAPHKPLLVLYALGRLQRDGARRLSYEEVKENLAELLAEFGPSRPPKNNFPFVRLANDGVWELSKPLDTGGTTVTLNSSQTKSPAVLSRRSTTPWSKTPTWLESWHNLFWISTSRRVCTMTFLPLWG